MTIAKSTEVKFYTASILPLENFIMYSTNKPICANVVWNEVLSQHKKRNMYQKRTTKLNMQSTTCSPQEINSESMTSMSMTY